MILKLILLKKKNVRTKWGVKELLLYVTSVYLQLNKKGKKNEEIETWSTAFCSTLQRHLFVFTTQVYKKVYNKAFNLVHCAVRRGRMIREGECLFWDQMQKISTKKHHRKISMPHNLFSCMTEQFNWGRRGSMLWHFSGCSWLNMKNVALGCVKCCFCGRWNK